MNEIIIKNIKQGRLGSRYINFLKFCASKDKIGCSVEKHHILPVSLFPDYKKRKMELDYTYYKGTLFSPFYISKTLW